MTSLLGSSMSTVAIAWAVLESGVNATGLGSPLPSGPRSSSGSVPSTGC
jgi:hypothetical protein